MISGCFFVFVWFFFLCVEVAVSYSTTSWFVFWGAFLFWVVFFVVLGFTSCMGGMLGLAFVVVNAC